MTKFLIREIVSIQYYIQSSEKILKKHKSEDCQTEIPEHIPLTRGSDKEQKTDIIFKTCTYGSEAGSHVEIYSLYNRNQHNAAPY